MSWRGLNLLALCVLLPIGLTLYLWGQPLVADSGTIRLWVNETWSPETSQQIADWYSLSHFIHGLLLGLVSLWRPRLGLVLAVATGIGWELLEHTDWVLDTFRSQTIYQGYVGDTVLNACCDYLFMFAGFHAARALRLKGTLAAILALEIFSTVMARDNLTLSTIRVLFPIEALSKWQDAINPTRAKAADGA